MLDLDRHQPDLMDTGNAAPVEEYTDVPADAINEHDAPREVVESADDDFQEAITAPAEEDGSAGSTGNTGAANMAGQVAAIGAIEAPRADAGDEPTPRDKDPDIDWGAGDPLPEGAEPDPDEVDLARSGGDGGEPPFDEPPTGGNGESADDEEPDDNGDQGGETAEQREVRLPMGIANEFFERSGAEAGDFAQHPQTAEDWHNNAIYSMAALAEVEHEALAEGADRGRAAGEGTALSNKYAEDGTSMAPTEEIAGEYNVEDYQGSRNPAPGIAANYIEHLDAESGEIEYVVKVQPEIPLPEFGENASLAEVQAQYAAYEAATANPTEFVWESQQAQRIHVLHGDAPAVELHNLPVDRMIETARFLRNAAIRGALARRNIRIVERLLPLE